MNGLWNFEGKSRDELINGPNIDDKSINPFSLSVTRLIIHKRIFRLAKRSIDARMAPANGVKGWFQNAQGTELHQKGIKIRLPLFSRHPSLLSSVSLFSLAHRPASSPF